MTKKNFILIFFFIIILAALTAVFTVANTSVHKAYANGVTFEVNTPSDWAGIETAIADGLNNSFAGDVIILNCDLDGRGLSFFPSFSGTFYGNGHKIYNIEKTFVRSLLTETYYITVVSPETNEPTSVLTTFTGKIYDLEFVNPNLDKSGGIVVGRNEGIISNVTVTGGIISYSSLGTLASENYGFIENCRSSADINAAYNGVESVVVGGLVGKNYGEIKNCHYVGNIALSTRSVGSGGLVGYNFGRIYGCGSSAEIRLFRARNLDGSYKYETETPLNVKLGGLVGKNGDTNVLGTVLHSYFNGDFVSEETTFFAGGLLAVSVNTVMKYCYSSATAVGGTLFGITSQIYPRFSYGTVGGSSVPIAFDGSVGNEGIVKCFALNTSEGGFELYPASYEYLLYGGETGEGTTFDSSLVVTDDVSLTLPLSNEAIGREIMLNYGLTKLTDTLNADTDLEGELLWTGSEGQLPINSSLYEGEGTQASPYLIRSVNDILFLRAFFHNSVLSGESIIGKYYFRQDEDLDFEDISYDFVCSQRSFSGYYNGNNRVNYNFIDEFFFSSSFGEIYGLGFFADRIDSIVNDPLKQGSIENCFTDGQNYGETSTSSNIMNGAAYVSSFAYGIGSQPQIGVTSAESFSSGSGTENDPYVVTTREELAALNNFSHSQYAVLGNSIAINTYDETTKYFLNLASFSGHLDGRGYSIIGLNKNALFDTVSETATIKNLLLRGLIIEGQNASFLCSKNYGVLENIKVFGSLQGTSVASVAYWNYGTVNNVSAQVYCYAESGGRIAYENNGGSILHSQVTGDSSGNIGGIAYTSNNEGLIENCYSYGDCGNIVFSLGEGDVSCSISDTGLLATLWSGEELLSGNELIFSEIVAEIPTFDWSVWGYEINLSREIPTLRRTNRAYKQDVSGYFRPYSKVEKIYDKAAVSCADIENYVVTDAGIRNETVFSWTKDGEDYSASTIVSAGVYELTAEYGGTANSFAYSFKNVFTVKKTTFADGLQFSATGLILSNGYATIPSYVYNGTAYDITGIKLSEGVGDAVSYEYAVFREENPVLSVVSAGGYRVAITLKNDNYETRTYDRYFSVSKKSLQVTVASCETLYMGAAPEFSIAEVSGFEGDDTATILDGGQYSCSYTVGSNVGAYSIGFEKITDNYELSVKNGALTVKPLDIPLDQFSFIGTNFYYTGEMISIKATVYSNITVTYSNNTHREVGEYNVTAVFSKENHNSRTKTVKMKIMPVPLTITAKSYELNFGEDVPKYTYEPIVFLGSDTIACLNETPKFTCSYEVGTIMGEYEISISNAAAVTSPNYIISVVNGLLTVKGAYMDALFEYPDKTVVYNGEHFTSTIATGDYAVSVEYEYFFGGTKLTGTPYNAGIYEARATVTPNNQNYLMKNYLKTVFSAKLTITPATLTLTFNPSYEFVYSGVHRSVPYNGDLPPNGNWASITQTAVNSKNSVVSEFIGIDTYNVRMRFSGSANYKDYEIETVLRIIKKPIIAVISDTKVYSGSAQTPDFSFEGVCGSDVINTSISYKWQNNSITASVKNAGSYACLIVSQNTNYEITNTPTFTITPRPISLKPDFVEYNYGDNTDFVYIGKRYRTGGDFVVYKGMEIEETGDVVDITYNVSSKYSGMRNIVGVIDTANYDFSVSEADGENKVRINKRTLSYSWSIPSFTLEYNGREQKTATIALSNAAYDDVISYSIVYNGNVKDVGEYAVWVNLRNTDNYYLDAGIKTITITPAPLLITLHNVSVEVGKAPMYSHTVTGLQGSDTLLGLNLGIRYVCQYSMAYSNPGSTYEITIAEMSNPNYTIAVAKGLLTVTYSSNPVLTMTNRSFTYDGNAKYLTINETLPANTSIRYANNGNVDAGEYAVSAYVLFPNQDSQTINATMTIKRANAELISTDVTIPYSVTAFIGIGDLQYKAYLGERELSGSAVWSGVTELKRGTNEYSALFTPTDTKNIAPTPFLVQITGKVIGAEAFSVSGEHIIVGDKIYFYADGISIALSDVYTGMKLFVNDVETTKYDFSSVGSCKIEIRFGERIVYSQSYDIVDGNNIGGEEPEINKEIRELIEQDNNLFDFADVELSETGGLVVSSDALLRLKPEFSGNGLTVYKNGIPVQAVVVSPGEKEIRIEVKKNNVTIFRKSFSVTQKEEEAPTPEIIEKDKLLWLKILGGVLGGLVVVGGGVFLLLRSKGKIGNAIPKK